MENAKAPITAKAAFATLQAEGYPKSFVERLFPDWWDNSLLKTGPGALQFALLVQQRLGLEVRIVEDGSIAVHAGNIPASFKHRADTNVNDLKVAASLGIALARLAVFSCSQPYRLMASNLAQIRAEITSLSQSPHVHFEGLLRLCWSYGIPVLFLKEIPQHTRKAAGMAVMVEGRPAILLGYNFSDRSRQLFVLAHELGHILRGHIPADGALIDEELVNVSDALEGSVRVLRDEQEREADAFALQLIRGSYPEEAVKLPRMASGAILAKEALGLASRIHVDVGHIILTYALTHDDWILANKALSFLPQQTGAIRLLQEAFLAHTDLASLSEENAKHLLYMQGITG